MSWKYRTLIALVVAMPITGCRKPEPIVHGNYHIDNRTAMQLQLHATTWHGVPNFVTTEVPPNSRVHFMNVSMGSGGHLFPSNFLSTFSVTAGDSVLYEGVRNDDWQREAAVAKREQFVLVIGP